MVGATGEAPVVAIKLEVMGASEEVLEVMEASEEALEVMEASEEVPEAMVALAAIVEIMAALVAMAEVTAVLVAAQGIRVVSVEVATKVDLVVMVGALVMGTVMVTEVDSVMVVFSATGVVMEVLVVICLVGAVLAQQEVLSETAVDMEMVKVSGEEADRVVLEAMDMGVDDISNFISNPLFFNPVLKAAGTGNST